MLGDAVLMLLAALGVAALLQANPLWFTGVQYLGATYLCWLGLRLLFATGEGGAIVFYMAFFPLFIEPATHQGASTFIAIAAIILCCTLTWGSILVFAGNVAAARLKNNRNIAALSSKFAGLFLIGFGIKITTN